MKLAEMIRLYLAANNIDQKKASAEIGFHESILSRFLSESNMPDAENFMKILCWVTGTKIQRVGGKP